MVYDWEGHKKDTRYADLASVHNLIYREFIESVSLRAAYNIVVRES